MIAPTIVDVTKLIFNPFGTIIGQETINGVRTLNSSLGFLGKTLKDIKADWKDTDGIKDKITGVFTSQQKKDAKNFLEKDIEALEDYFAAIKNGRPPTEALEQTMSKASATAQNFARDNDITADSIRKFRLQQEAAKKSTIGLTIAQTAANMAISLGASLLIQLAVTGISKLIHANEEAIKKAEEVIDSFNKQQDALKSNKETIDSIADSYPELARGVDSLGRNVSLNTEEYARYNEIVNKIAEMFPTMVQGYTDEGNAIIIHKGSVEALTEAYKEQKQAAQDAIIVGSHDVFKGFKASFENGFLSKGTGTKIEQERFLSDLLAGKLDSAENLNKTLQEYSLILGDVEEILNEAGVETSFVDYYGSMNDKILNDENSSKIQAYYRTLTSEINAEVAKVKPILNAFLETGDDYKSLSDEAQDTVRQIVSQFGADFYTQFDNEVDMASWVSENLVAKFKGTEGEKVTQAFSSLFTVKEDYLNGDITTGKYLSSLENLRELTDGFDDETKKTIEFLFKVDGLDPEGMKENLLKRNGGFTKDLLDTLDFGELKIAYELENVGRMSWDELLEKLKEAKIAALDVNKSFDELSRTKNSFNEGSITSEEYVEKLQDQLNSVNKIIEKNPELAESYYGVRDAIQSAINTAPSSIDELVKSTDTLISSASTLSSAFAEQNENGRLSAETILKMVDAGYAAALSIDQETGAVTLNKDAYIALTRAHIEEQIAKLELSKVDLTNKLIQEQGAAKQAAIANYDLSISYLAMAEATGASIQNVDASIAALTQLKNSIGDVAAGNYGGSGGKSAADKMSEEFQKAYAYIQYLRDKGVISEEEYLNRLFALNEKYNKNNAETWRKYDLEIFNGRQKLLEEQLKAQGQAYIDAIDIKVKALEKEKKAEQERYDAEIEHLREQKQELQDQWDEEDDLLELEKKRIALANAQRQKNAQIYRKGQGFVWEADPEAVANAQEDLNQAQTAYDRKKAEKEIDRHIKALEKEKKKTEENLQAEIDKWNDLKDNIQESMSHIGETLAEHQNQMELLAEAEAMSFDKMSAAAQNYANSVEDALQRVLDAKAQFAGKEYSDRVISTGGGYKPSNNNKPSNPSSTQNNTQKAENEAKRKSYNSQIASLKQQLYLMESQYNSIKMLDPSGAKQLLKSINSKKADITILQSKLNALPQYASGTKNAKGGIIVKNEDGTELHLTQPQKGQYSIAQDGDVIFNRRETLDLKGFVESPATFLIDRLRENMLIKPNLNFVQPNNSAPVTEQHYHISNLTFPSVGSADEIKRAIMELPNYAMQKVHVRK